MHLSGVYTLQEKKYPESTLFFTTPVQKIEHGPRKKRKNYWKTFIHPTSYQDNWKTIQLEQNESEFSYFTHNANRLHDCWKDISTWVAESICRKLCHHVAEKLHSCAEKLQQAERSSVLAKKKNLQYFQSSGFSDARRQNFLQFDCRFFSCKRKLELVCK